MEEIAEVLEEKVDTIQKIADFIRKSPQMNDEGITCELLKKNHEDQV